MTQVASALARFRDLTHRQAFRDRFVPPVVVPALIVAMVLILGALRLWQA